MAALALLTQLLLGLLLIGCLARDTHVSPLQCLSGSELKATSEFLAVRSGNLLFNKSLFLC